MVEQLQRMDLKFLPAEPPQPPPDLTPKLELTPDLVTSSEYSHDPVLLDRFHKAPRKSVDGDETIWGWIGDKHTDFAAAVVVSNITGDKQCIVDAIFADKNPETKRAFRDQIAHFSQYHYGDPDKLITVASEFSRSTIDEKNKERIIREKLGFPDDNVYWKEYNEAPQMLAKKGITMDQYMGVYPGAVELLQMMAEDGEVYLVTHAREEKLKTVLDQIVRPVLGKDPKKFFNKILGFEDLVKSGERKPFPNGAFVLMKAANDWDPRHWAHIGDGKTDIGFAYHNGWTPVALTHGRSEEYEPILEEMPHLQFDTHMDIHEELISRKK